MTVNRTHLLALVHRASVMTDEARRTNPDAAIFRSIEAQLRAIRSDVVRAGPFDPTIQKRVNIGLLAVREFEQTDPGYAEVLERIAFLHQDEGVLR